MGSGSHIPLIPNLDFCHQSEEPSGGWVGPEGPGNADVRRLFSEQSETCCALWNILSSLPSHRAVEPPLVGCPRLRAECIASYASYGLGSAR